MSDATNNDAVNSDAVNSDAVDSDAVNRDVVNNDATSTLIGDAMNTLVGDAMQHFYWNERAIPYRAGETLALALRRAGVAHFGAAACGQQARYFCGIGQCQGCLVSVNGGAAVESCLTPAQPLAVVTPGAF